MKRRVLPGRSTRWFQGRACCASGGFQPGDTLLLGRESAGAPDFVHYTAALRVRIAQMPGTRSLNVAVAAGIVLSEALRQTGGLPAQ